jgi:hypothetical protein
VSKTYIPAELRRQVREDAGHRCGYCHISELISATELVVDHILPESSGGPTARENLWLICTRCNQFKGSKTHAIDPQTGENVLLFNPRTQVWAEHFTWSSDGVEIVGLTTCGRATVNALHLNRELVVLARRRWVSVGWHPPNNE